jgi:hypothetical protein
MDLPQFWNLIFLTSPIVLLIGIFIGIFIYGHLSKGFRVIVYYLVICLITDLISRYFGSYSHLKFNLFLIPIFGFLELVVFSTLYYKYILQSKSIPLLLFMILMLLLIVFEFVFADKLFNQKSFWSFGKVIADLSIISFCLLYYWEVFKGEIEVRDDISFLNATVIVYYSINMILYLFINFLVNENLRIVNVFWMVNLISMISFYLVLIWLIWQDGKTRKILQ